MLTETAPAKINLALHVRRRRADGRHDLETIFAFAHDGDTLAAAPADGLSLTVTGPFAAGLGQPDDLVLRAARALAEAAGIAPRAALTLDKRLPVAAGVGGGSADAAAALRLLARLWDTRVPLDPVARGLGADVPACLAGRTLRGEGAGEDLASVPGAESLSGTPLLLVNPGVAMPTGPVFKAWDGVDRGPLGQGDPLTAALAGRNDLEPPAIALAPAIATLLDRLRRAPGVRLARMSGSGATCFALFETPAARDAAADALAPLWTLATTLR